MKILITGAAGYIGSKLATHLGSNEDVSEIIAVDNLMYRQSSPLSWAGLSKVKFHCQDVRDHIALGKLTTQADIIIPLAAIVGMPACDRDPVLAKEVNQDHIQFLCKSLSNNQRILMPNTNSGYGKGQGLAHCTEETPLLPISVYGVTKCEAEKAVLDAGGTTLRLATVFGVSPRMRLDLLVNDFVLRARRDKFLVLFEPHFKRNYIHVSDVVSVFSGMIYRAMGDQWEQIRGQAFNLGLSDANLSKMELAETIKKHVPDVNIFVSEFSKDPDQRNYIVSNEKIEKLGFKPRFDLDYGIKELLEYYPVFDRIANKDFSNL